MEKGQATIEFMLTYGWIILIFAVITGALLYFGYLSPETFSSEHCEIIPGLDCKDIRATSNELVLVIANKMGQDVFVKRINDPAGKCSFEEGKSIKNGEQETFVLSSCKYPSKGERLKTELDFNYQSSTGFEHKEKAMIITYIK